MELRRSTTQGDGALRPRPRQQKDIHLTQLCLQTYSFHQPFDLCNHHHPTVQHFWGGGELELQSRLPEVSSNCGLVFDSWGGRRFSISRPSSCTTLCKSLMSLCRAVSVLISILPSMLVSSPCRVSNPVVRMKSARCKAPNVFFMFVTGPAKVRSSTWMGQVILEKTRALPESFHRLMHLPSHPIMIGHIMHLACCRSASRQGIGCQPPLPWVAQRT